MLITAIVAGLTLSGLAIAAAAIKPLRDVAAMAPTAAVRRAWSVLNGTIVACILLQAVALATKLSLTIDVGDAMAAFVHLLGPAFVLAVACLARRTARDILRIGELEKMALVDPLTLLPNRRAFETALAAEIGHRSAAGSPLHLVLLDIDHFKQVNDRFGHQAGDVVLCQVAAIVRDASRGLDVAYRIGGEELAIISPGRSAREVMSGIERLRRAIECTCMVVPGGDPFGVTVSFGAAALAAHDSSDTLFGRADRALYAAKRAGRNRTRVAA